MATKKKQKTTKRATKRSTKRATKRTAKRGPYILVDDLVNWLDKEVASNVKSTKRDIKSETKAVISSVKENRLSALHDGLDRLQYNEGFIYGIEELHANITDFVESYAEEFDEPEPEPLFESEDEDGDEDGDEEEADDEDDVDDGLDEDE